MIIQKHKLNGRVGERLKQLPDAPKQLFYKGTDPEFLLSRPSIAIVGSRKMSAYGEAVTKQLAGELARAGIVVVSGLALGIDSAAHKATIEAGGAGLAVMAHGLHMVHPSSHAQLAEKLLANGGSLVSEYEEGMPALRHTFVARDRLIAALADAVLVTEAAQKSGSLHTAGFALDLGKPVMAVPGPITSPTSAGTNHLIKTGALTVTSVEDIFLALGLNGAPRQQTLSGLSKEEEAIINALQNGISDGTELLKASCLSAVVYAQTITMLEINGRIRSLGLNNWALA